MLYFLSPRKVADMDQSVYTFFKFYEYTEVGEVAYFSCMLASDRIFNLDCFPWIFLQLFDTQRHLALFAVESQDNCFYLVAYMQEFLCRTKMLAPAHF